MYSNLGVAPSQDASDHQNYYIFNRESQPKPSFTTVTVRGPHPTCNALLKCSTFSPVLPSILRKENGSKPKVLRRLRLFCKNQCTGKFLVGATKKKQSGNPRVAILPTSVLV